MIRLSSKTFCSPPPSLLTRLLPLRANRTLIIKENVLRAASEFGQAHRHLCPTSSGDHHLWLPYLLSHITIGGVGGTTSLLVAIASIRSCSTSLLLPLGVSLPPFFLFWHDSSHCILEYFVSLLFFCPCCCLSLSFCL